MPGRLPGSPGLDVVQDVCGEFRRVQVQRGHRDGVPTRAVYPTVPPRVEYRLTGLGREAGGLVQRVTDWAQANMAAMRAAREEFDGRAVRQLPGAAS
ncbi:winged helix-turn-helix transcriptional regulator [Streptomyces sp. NPDC059627]